MNLQPNSSPLRCPQTGVIDLSVPLSVRRLISEFRPDTAQLETRVPDVAASVGASLARMLDPATLRAIARFREAPTTDGTLILRGAAAGIPDTVPAPYDGATVSRETERASAILLGYLWLAGLVPLAFEDENGGRVLRLVVANPAAHDAVSSQGSGRAFGPHVDNDNRPHWFEWHPGLPEPIPAALGFVCVNPDPDVPTWVAPLARILERLDPRDVQTLAGSNFCVYPPSSNEAGNVLVGVPVLTPDPDGNHVCRADVTHTKGMTVRATEALDALGRAATEAASPLRLNRSDVCLFWNEYTMHCRGAYAPRGDATDRLLVRVYGRRELEIGNPVDPNAPWRRR